MAIKERREYGEFANRLAKTVDTFIDVKNVKAYDYRKKYRGAKR